MKCIHCGNDSKYRDRAANGNRCRACKHPFAFEPRSDPRGVTDGMFQAFIRKVSADGKLTFTERQLWYEFNRRFSRPRGSCAVGAAGLALATAGVGCVCLYRWLPGAAGRGAGLLAASLACAAGPGARTKREPATIYARVSFADFTGYLRKWTQAHGAVAGLLPPLDRDGAAPALHPDILAYSFDRALVTNRAETAAMLVANRFHFENNCAILSLDGFPFAAAPAVMAMLRNNPQLTVFALHDSSAPGCALGPSLRQPEWFPDPAVRVVGLGLRPQHAQQLRILCLRGQPTTVSQPARAFLTPEEIAWLETGNLAELDALRPAKLMRAIYQGFARETAARSPDDAGGVVYVDSGPSVWMYDGGADYYAADSFG